jgi:hypothetical protein
LLHRLPTCVIAMIIETIGFLSITLGLPTPFQKAEAVGTYFIYNLMDYNANVVYTPLVSAARCPVIFNLTAPFDAPEVENGEVVLRKIFNLCVTVDHRYLDGMKVVSIQNQIREILREPEKYITIE